MKSDGEEVRGCKGAVQICDEEEVPETLASSLDTPGRSHEPVCAPSPPTTRKGRTAGRWDVGVGVDQQSKPFRTD